VLGLVEAEAHIANLRRRTEPADGERLIHTDHGVGYRLADVHPDGTDVDGLRKKWIHPELVRVTPGSATPA
jgi:hypothetical protein